MGVVLKSFGHFIPKDSLRNAELAVRFGITEQYIVEKTGIEQRAYNTGGAASDMIVAAAKNCLKLAGISPIEIDCVLVATMTPDYYCPSTASVVHHKLGTDNASGFDIMASCSGYIYALQLASSLIAAGTYKNILLCGAEKFSSVIDPQDRKTVLIFADGAGVTLVQHSENENDVIDTLCKLDSASNMDVNIMLGGSKAPLTKENVTDGNRFVRFSSRDIFDNGVILFKRVIEEALSRNRLTFDDIDYIIPHQANKIMIETVAKALKVPIEKFIVNIENIGNTGAATIPIAISQGLESGKLKGGEKVLLASVGAGFTYAAGIIKLQKS